MNACTFIGHKDAPKELRNSIRVAIEDLILNKGITQFYVGTHGSFDYMVREVLKELEDKYEQIKYNIVLAYIPQKKNEYEDYIDTIYPDGVESVPPRFAIIERNKWMIKNSGFLICYVKHKFSNEYEFKEFAEKKGKIIIEL